LDVYRLILVPVENSEADRAILDHVKQLARLTGARLLLLHVADGWAARHFETLELRESEEMRQDREYLDRLTRELTTAGVACEARLTMGDPAREIIRAAEESGADLVAMATHGHRLLGDILHGATAGRVRHALKVPVLLVRAP
jgi:nucleotide-binding universal stress UspA family protein